MRAMLRPMRPRPTRPSVLPARSSPIHCAVGHAQPVAVHRALDRLELLRQREHQRERAFRDRLLGVFGHVDHRDAARHRRLDVDRVDADAVFDDALELAGRCDDARRTGV